MQNIMGFPVRLTVATLVAVSYSSAFGFWEDKSGEVKIKPTDGEVFITETDKPPAEVTKISIDYSAKLTVKDLASKWEMTTPLSGMGRFLVKNCADNLIINADNRDYTGDNGGYKYGFTVEGAGTTVIVSNRYGLGSSSYKRQVSLGSGTSIKFGGEGLTNDVGISCAYGVDFDPQWAGETGTFVQNADLSCNNLIVRNAEVTAGKFYTLLFWKVANGCSLTTGTNVCIQSTAGATSAALGLGVIDVSTNLTFYLASSQANHYRQAQINGVNTKIVCMGENALNTDDSLAASMGYLQVHNKTQYATLDLNGYDQKLPWIATYTYQSDNTHLAVTSAAPATLTFTCRDAAAKAGDLVFYGAASFCYAGAEGSSYTWKYGNSMTTGKLSVKSGTFVWGAATGVDTIWGGPEVEASGTGTLQLMAKSKFGYVDEKGTNASRLTISDSATVNLPDGVTTEVGYLVADGKEYRKGIYGSQEAFEAGLVDANHIVPGLSGKGLLKVLRSPFGLMILFR